MFGALLLCSATAFASPPPPIVQSACELAPGPASATAPQRGIATWYGWNASESGTNALSSTQLTAASATLPVPSCARITNLSNQISIVALIDRKSPKDSYGLLQLGAGAAAALGVEHSTPIAVSDIAPAATNATAPELETNDNTAHYLWTAAYSGAISAASALYEARHAGIASLCIVLGLEHGAWAYRLRLGPLPANLSPTILAQTLQHAGFDFHTLPTN